MFAAKEKASPKIVEFALRVIVVPTLVLGNLELKNHYNGKGKACAVFLGTTFRW